MPKLRRLSGSEVIGILAQFGFVVHSQRSSHAKLRRLGAHGEKQTLIVPMHRKLDTGTLRVIFQQACKYIPADDLWAYFYTP